MSSDLSKGYTPPHTNTQSVGDLKCWPKQAGEWIRGEGGDDCANGLWSAKWVVYKYKHPRSPFQSVSLTSIHCRTQSWTLTPGPSRSELLCGFLKDCCCCPVLSRGVRGVCGSAFTLNGNGEWACSGAVLSFNIHSEHGRVSPPTA